MAGLRGSSMFLLALLAMLAVVTPALAEGKWKPHVQSPPPPLPPHHHYKPHHYSHPSPPPPHKPYTHPSPPPPPPTVTPSPPPPPTVTPSPPPPPTVTPSPPPPPTVPSSPPPTTVTPSPPPSTVTPSPPPVYCNKPGGVCHDPVLVGADGMQFYFHGHKDAQFCLVSDSDLHVNAHFIGKRAENMPRDFTWVQSIGILFGANQLYVGANKVATWNDNVDQLTVAFGASPIVLPSGEGASWTMPAAGLAITRVAATNAVSIHVDGKLKLLARVVPITEAENQKHNYGITADNCFAHLELSFNFLSLTSSVSGVLGQTYAPTFKSLHKLPGQLMPTMPQESKYQSSSLMASDCAVSTFGSATAAEILTNLKPMSCAQGGSAGMVCRR